MAGFLGMRGTGDWATDQRPYSWRDAILRLYPNGDAPLTAIMAKMKSEKTDDPLFNWWTKGLPTQRATLTEVYTDAALSSAYSSGGVAGSVLYAKMSAADAGHFRAGHQVIFRLSTSYLYDINAKVVAVGVNGASSYVAAKLLQADASSYVASADTMLVIGNINAEGAPMPDAITYDPTKLYGYTQIFRTPLEITRTARKTRLRTGDAYKEMKREALELHSIEMEKAFIFGYPTENTGDNGKKERTTGGIVYHIGAYSGIASSFVTDTSAGVSGKTWAAGGEDWLDYYLEKIFRYGSEERLAFCGSNVLLAINKLVKQGGNYTFTPKTGSYGIKVMEWVTPFGTINMKRHPLFSYEATNSASMLVISPEDLTYRYIDDTTFYDDPEKKNTGYTRRDGTKEEFLTECGLEIHHPSKFGWLHGFGSDNTQ
jgi:hypothetical protein